MDSFDLQDELQGLQNLENYEIRGERDIGQENLEELLERVVESVATNSSAVADEEVFGVYCSILKNAEDVSGLVMKQLLDSILSGLQAEVEATNRDLNDADEHVYMAHKMPLEIYAFLLFWFLTAAEKVKLSDKDAEPAKGKKGKGAKGAGAKSSKKVDTKWSWIDQVKPTLALVAKVLLLPLQRIWVPTPQRETFISCITRPAIYATETEAYMKSSEIKNEVFKVLCRSVKTHGQALAVQIAIMQSLQFYEHLSEPFAELLDILQATYDYPQLGDEVLRDIAKKTFSGDNNDSKLPRSFAKFLTEYAERCPRLVFKQLDALQDQLNSEAYPIRQALVEVLGSIIIELSNNGDADNADNAATTKRITSLFDVLLERVMDVSSYVRVKTFQVFAKLTEAVKPRMPKHRIAMTRAATGALDDKTATVRKAATHLLIQLLLTHPYGMIDGGKLDKLKCQEEYDKYTANVAKFDDAIGKAVEINQNGAEASEEDEEDEQEDGQPRKSKKSKKARDGDEDAMDVDENGGDTDVEDEDDEDEDKMSETEDGEGATPRKKKSKKLKPRKSQLDLNALNEEQAVVANFDAMEIQQMRNMKKYYADAILFIDLVEGAMDVLCGLLGSKSKAEVLEVMDFFRVAYEIGFVGATDGIRKMLHLVWKKDDTQTSEEDGKELKGIKQRLLETYRLLYFDPIEGLPAKNQIARIAKNLIQQTSEATLAELTSLEEMMRIMMEDGQIHQDVVAKLWQIYGSKLNLPKSQRRGSIIILGMLALAKRSILTDKVDLLLSMGLGPQGQADPTLARYTCIALQRLNGSAKKVKGSLANKSQRIEMDNKIFRKLQSVILYPSRTKEWFGMAEQIINTVYALGEHPDIFANEVIKRLTTRAFSPRRRAGSQPAAGNEDSAPAADADASGDVTMNLDGEPATQTQNQDATQSMAASGADNDDLGEAFELSQLIFVVGHVAIKHIAFLELIEREWKRQKDEKQAAEKQASGDKKSKDHDELDQVAGNAEDDIGDRISAVRETELLYGENSLLALYGPMIVHIAGSPNIFKNRVLRATASLAFGKLLCVSSTFCDTHYRLLFKILETSKDVNIRSNVIIALGDVAVSFSTIIDENSNELYKGLSDPELVVKKNTLMVLTHLILNGMIKVKGQLGEMAKCVEDPEPRISDLAKLFFTDLATKDNAIYNNLPDVISHLSTGEHAVDENVFQETLKYIFTFIEKDKQTENVVEKLCQRFRLTDEPRQWRDIAFCLSLLPYKSDRSLKKLIEGLQHYRDKLHEPTVFKLFTEILTKARSNKSRDKTDTELNEFEQILNEHRAQGAEDQALEKRVEGTKAAAKKRATRKTARAKKVATPPPVDDDDDMYGSD